jgi:hypothetical protein
MNTRQRLGLATMFFAGMFFVCTVLDGSKNGDWTVSVWIFMLAVGITLFVAPK